MNDQEKLENILIELNEIFPVTEIEPHRQVGRGLHCFYVRPSVQEQMILKITDECLMNNPLDKLLDAIKRRCLSAMKENLNMEVVLFNDMHIEVNEAH